jgi:hypothetical protein
MIFVLFQVKEVPTVVIKEATPSPADSEADVSTPPSASGILNNAAEIP